VIVNEANDISALKADEVSKIFSKGAPLPNGKMCPVDCRERSGREAFSAAVHVSQWAFAYAAADFSGGRPAAEKSRTSSGRVRTRHPGDRLRLRRAPLAPGSDG